MKSKMLSLLMMGLMAACWAPVALAQEDEQDQSAPEHRQVDQDGDQDQDRDQAQARDRDEHRGPRRDRSRRAPTPARVLRMLEKFQGEVTKRIEMDDEQRQDITALFKEHLSTLREVVEAQRERAKENRQAVRELMRELREAREAQDENRLGEIRRQLAARSDSAADFARMNDEFFMDLRAMLNEDQVEQYDRILKRFKSMLKPQRSGAGMHEIRRAVQSLDLTDEQNATIKEVFVQAFQQTREARGDPDRVREIETSLLQTIIKELDEEQVAAFERKMKEIERTRGEQTLRERPRKLRRAADRGQERARDHAGDEDDDGADNDVDDDVDDDADDDAAEQADEKEQGVVDREIEIQEQEEADGEPAGEPEDS